jgi:calcium/calmodulin-dependent protein kinase I
MLQTKSRYCVLTSKFLFIFKDESESLPMRIIFIGGCYIEYLSEDDQVTDGHFSFAIIQGDKADESQNKDIFTARSAEERKLWVTELRKCAKTVPISEVYEILHPIGKGKFSTIHVGIEKATNKRYAIKILDKLQINEGDRETLRQEIATLNVVRHPRIIQMKEVFETQEHIYIVLRLYEHSDLLKYMKTRKSRIPEVVIKKIVWNLVDAVMYLHSLGIVHRDLKPENILLEDYEDLSKIVLSDFGLSKFATPREIMRLTCGTLSYVAPEVLRLNGYTKAVDFWSIGVIMYALLCGQLPFKDAQCDNMGSGISKVLRSQLKFVPDEIWKTVSIEAPMLLTEMLRPNPEERATGEKILEHKWFDEIRGEMAHPEKLEEEDKLGELMRGISTESSGAKIVDGSFVLKPQHNSNRSISLELRKEIQ